MTALPCWRSAFLFIGLCVSLVRQWSHVPWISSSDSPLQEQQLNAPSLLRASPTSTDSLVVAQQQQQEQQRQVAAPPTEVQQVEEVREQIQEVRSLHKPVLQRQKQEPAVVEPEHAVIVVESEEQPARPSDSTTGDVASENSVVKEEPASNGANQEVAVVAPEEQNQRKTRGGGNKRGRKKNTKSDNKKPSWTPMPVMESDPNYDAFDTPSVQCRRGMSQWQNDNIDFWMLNMPYPLIEWIWERQDETTNQTYYFGFMNIMREKGWTEKNAKLIQHFDWIWKDQYGNEYPMPKEAMWHTSIYWTRVYFRLDPPAPAAGADPIVPQVMWPMVAQDPKKQYRKHKATKKGPEYNLQPYIKCNKVDQQHPPPPTPSGDVKIGACITRFWDQYDLIPEWVAYHRMVGIQHFWFFVGEDFDNIRDKVPQHEPDITYVPYNFNWKDHKHNAPGADSVRWEGEDYFQETWFQVSANNQCLYNARQYGLDFVITPDLDEFIVVQDQAVTHFQAVPTPLQQVLYQNWDPVQNQNIAEVCIFGAAFGRHPERQALDKSKFGLAVDFIYRKHKKHGNFVTVSDGKGAGGRRKCFYNTHVAKGVTIHFRDFDMDNGESETAFAMDDQMELYHYRSPLLGPAETEVADLKKYPQFRDMYRERIAYELNTRQWAWPNFQSHMDAGYNDMEGNNEATATE